jgi:hypothetical protein
LWLSPFASLRFKATVRPIDAIDARLDRPAASLFARNVP